MKTRLLGKSGIRVSEIGFGAWGIGGAVGGSIAYGPVDRAESILALRTAHDIGINFFDTSDFYGFGESESAIGEALSGLRSDVVIASKVGMLTSEAAQDFTPKHIRTSIEGSLRRLRTDYIDLYQLHSPPTTLLDPNSEAVMTLDSLKEEGKIRAWGISTRSPQDAKRAIVDLNAAAIQLNFNLVDQRALSDGIFALAGEYSTGIIVRTPLSFGFLTGRYSADQKYDDQDHRSRWSREQIKRWAEANRLFSELVSMDDGQTAAQFALRFCLSLPEVSTTIPGMLTHAHVTENAQASEMGPLSGHTLELARSIYGSNQFFVRS